MGVPITRPDPEKKPRPRSLKALLAELRQWSPNELEYVVGALARRYGFEPKVIRHLLEAEGVLPVRDAS
jgi:hypothetical protein